MLPNSELFIDSTVVWIRFEMSATREQRLVLFGQDEERLICVNGKYREAMLFEEDFEKHIQTRGTALWKNFMI